jgi:ParB-like chromosome segregation protein Spo0J
VDDDLSELVRSIADNCILVPLVVRRANNEIVAGVRRFWVAYSLGIRKVPVRYINCTDLEARQAFVFSRNR